MSTYATRTDAIKSEIVNAIKGDEVPTDAAVYAEYDVEAIAAKVLGDYSQGYALVVDEDTFWATVSENAK